MEKKLALLIGVLLSLHLAQFFGADFQVKANETTDTELKTSLDLERSGDSNGLNLTLDYQTKRNEVKNLGGGNGAERNGSSLVKAKSNKPKNLGKDQSVENGRKVDVIVVEPKKSLHQAKTKGDLNAGVKLDEDRRKSSEEEAKKPLNVEKGKGESGEKNKKDDEIVEAKDLSRNREENGVVKNDEIRKSDEKQGVVGVGNLKLPEETTGSSVDECYLSIKCTDAGNQLIACLRVPGNESPHLSLLIQNKGNDSLTVDISAPNFVQLDRTKVQLKKKENTKVEVSIGNEGTDSLIILRAGNRVCNLDFKDLITQNSSPKFAYLGLPAQRPTIAFMSFAALLIVVSAWLFVSFRRRKLLSIGGFTYQKLDTGLPVSVGGKQKLTDNEGWDEDWGDDWDDEETPRTPSKPSPSLTSSKRLASRRLSKETWKD
ncbi:hypothetical protein CsatB_004717 [Cannabis sativa]|uniref:uncharacterized protein LOC133038030 n=1 Tax=Cannabis sativa TaxID=3483 RepID=UPI0029C9FD96|nr:uncharacterized protein LOC133038030 [Cannabis sativa]XP_060971971.1 uncharacterized protein LOC133038030 [Cannabis sativa]XP_060971972.1 uncharacterized protein LOC133038030 [Cannabis sativa]XP_060971973.1 uncharacterized protein LOC133038030 [Cannabis sativa]